LLERSGKMSILTDRVNNPSVVANVLKSAFRTHATGSGQAPQSAITMYVCERLGYPDERITKGTPSEIASASFSDPNVVIVMKDGVQGAEVRGQETNVKFGLREDEIGHERGLITKDEVRAVTLHKLRLPQSGVLWDIGAGSGSVSLEAAGLFPGLSICAVEKDDARISMIRENALRHQAGNVRVVHGSAPEALLDLPAPDRVFIGGSGRNLGDIIRLVNEKMPAGLVVINAASLDTLGEALAVLDSNGYRADVAEISVSRSKVVAGKRLMSALNPVFVIRGEKG